MTESAAMAAHRCLVEYLDVDPCEQDDCDRPQLAMALSAVAWLHCPAQWFNAIMRGKQTAGMPDDCCHSCGVPYPCQNITAITDEVLT